MKWKKLSIMCQTGDQEVLANFLLENGTGGLQIKEGKNNDQITIIGYFAVEINLAPLIAKLKKQIDVLPVLRADAESVQVKTEIVDDSAWLNKWKRYYHPTQITRYLAVAPSWKTIPLENTKTSVIRLDPGQSFGTGTHPTTVLALQALETTVTGNESMIDVGTGSGVLSIAAKYLGVGHIDAYDVDDESIKAAQYNFDLNPVAADIKLKKNNLLEGSNDKVDLIVANILAEIILPLLPQAAQHLKPEGKLILSGIITDKLSAIKAALGTAGFRIEETLNIKAWYSIIAVLAS